MVILSEEISSEDEDGSVGLDRGIVGYRRLTISTMDRKMGIFAFVIFEFRVGLRANGVPRRPFFY